MKKYLLLLIMNVSFVLSTLGQTTTEIAKTGISSTVSIIGLDNISQPLSFGSGFLIDDELIATNVHVIEGSSSAYVLKNGEEKKYSVSGYVSIDRANDLVILKVSGLHGSNLSLGSNTPPEIGEKIFAVGNPKGLNGTFSEGIVSGFRNFQTNQVLQITAPISPGSSGGPVLNSSGQVVGIAFASYAGGQNLNFAVPVKYLLILKNSIGVALPISKVKPQPKLTTTTNVTPNIKEGVSVKNVVRCPDAVSPYGRICFTVKNDLPYRISDITILFLAYDKNGNVFDYTEDIFFKYKSWETDDKDKGGVKPFLARTINLDTRDESTPELSLDYGSIFTIKARILDFKIIEE
jgi:hypothetical protein